MSKMLVFILCLLFTVKSINCIKCYSCISTENPDCLTPEKLEKQLCDSDGLTKTSMYASNMNTDFREIFDVELTEQAIPLNCLKLVVKVQGQEVILRGCQLPRDSQRHLDVCRKINELQSKHNMNVMHCSLCESDGCNASSIIGVSKMCVLATLVISALKALNAF